MRALLLLAALLASGCSLRTVPLSAWLPHAAMTVSLGCEAADLGTTLYWQGYTRSHQDIGAAVGALPPAPRTVADYPLRYTATRGLAAAGTNTGLWLLQQREPLVAAVGYGFNALIKCVLARDADALMRRRFKQ